jgi:transcription elongation factor GreA
MNVEKIAITPEGVERLKKEIEQIKSVHRPANIKAIAEARAHGDLSENADYDAAKQEQGMIQARLLQAEAVLSRADVIDPTKLSGDDVKFGATVTLTDMESDEVVIYKLVSSYEADLKERKISIESPIGKALIGKNIGDDVVVKTPRGPREFGIEKVEYI